MEDATIQSGIVTQDQEVEDVEEELKTSGSFNMKKFREKLKSNDFITGRWNLFNVLIRIHNLFYLKNSATFYKKLHLIPV